MPYKDKEKRKANSKKYYKENKGEILRKGREYNQKPEVKKRNKKRMKEYLKEYRKNNVDKIKKRSKEYRQRLEVKKRQKEYMRKYCQKPKVKKRMKEYYQKNKVKIGEKTKKYEQRPEVKKRIKEYNQRLDVRERNNLIYKERYAKDIKFRIMQNLRKLLAQSFRYYSETGKILSSKKYGINFKVIIEHLKPFPKDIENYHVDHIIPLSLFDFNNPKHIKIAFAPENHQWLTIQQNLEKKNRLVMPH